MHSLNWSGIFLLLLKVVTGLAIVVTPFYFLYQWFICSI